MSARQRTGMRRKLRKLDAIEGVTLEFAGDEAERHEFMQQMIALHQERWRGRGRAGVFSSDVFRRFHEALSSRLLQRGQLLLARLQVEGRPLALVYGFISGKTCHYYQGGVDTEAYASALAGAADAPEGGRCGWVTPALNATTSCCRRRRITRRVSAARPASSTISV
jgi:CelD/BcsL family acetyltransferase involved in cellulose biosynthesis